MSFKTGITEAGKKNEEKHTGFFYNYFGGRFGLISFFHSIVL